MYSQSTYPFEGRPASAGSTLFRIPERRHRRLNAKGIGYHMGDLHGRFASACCL